MKFKVYWDNGNHACGTFPTVFDTYEDAEEYGEAWLRAMLAADISVRDDDEETYSYEVIEEG